MITVVNSNSNSGVIRLDNVGHGRHGKHRPPANLVIISALGHGSFRK